MKKGIALLITLTMLMGMSALVLKSFNISGKFFDDEKELKSMYQINRVFLDSKDILKSTFKDVNSTEAFNFLFSQPFPISSQYFNLIFSFTPIENKININNFLQKNVVQKEYVNIFENILISHNVADTDFLINLILDTIDEDNLERVYGSEISRTYPFFANKKIYSAEQFRFILDYYAQNRDDKSVYKIDWDKYIGFSGNNIDINFASIELLKFLLPNQNIDTNFKAKYYENYKDLNINEEEKKLLEKLKITFSTDEIHTKILFDDFTKKSMVEFDYSVSKETRQNIKYTF